MVKFLNSQKMAVAKAVEFKTHDAFRNAERALEALERQEEEEFAVLFALLH